MNCQEFLERFDLLADAESGTLSLEPNELEALRMHARECIGCRAESELVKELERAVKALPPVEPPDATLSFPSIEAKGGGSGRRVAAFSGIAALVTIVVMILVARGRQERGHEAPRPTPEPVASVPFVGADTQPEAKRLIELALQDPAAQENVMARLRGEPGLALSFLALARAVEKQFEVTHARGDLDGMLACLRFVETMDSLLLGSGNPIVFSAPEYAWVFLTNGFWLGYTLFASGDLEGAKTALRDYISRIDALEREHGPLNKEVEIVRDFRAKDVLEFLETRAGKPAPIDLDLGDSWVSSRRLSLRDSHNKVIALLFRGVGDGRSGAFLGPLAAFCEQRAEIRIVTVSYYPHEATHADSAERLKKDLEELGYEGPAGFDPDANAQKIFRTFHATVGSATFFIINKRGEIVWYMPDPRGMDVRFAETLLMRHASEAP